MFQFTFWMIPSLIGVAISGFVLRYLWTRRDEVGGRALTVMAIASLWWSLGQVIGLMVVSADLQVLVWQVQYVGIVGTPLAWFAFSLVYSGRRELLTRWTVYPIYAIGLATLVVVASNARHGLVWASLTETISGGFRGIIIEHGWWFRVHLGWAYAMVAVGTGVLGLHIAQSPRHWYKLSYVLGAPIMVLLPNLVYVTPLEPMGWVDLTPTGFSLGLATLTFGLLREGAAGFAPVARTAVVEEMGDLVIVVDERHQIVDVNRSARDILDLRVSGPVPIELGTMWVSSKAADTPEGTPQRLQLETKDGGVRDFEMRHGALGPQAGKGRSVVVLRDISETVKIESELRQTTKALEKANRELERRANTDGLTGLANRRHFLEVLEREIERAGRYARPLTLIMLDLDHFKQVNDTYGHAAGDAVLKAAAAALHRVSRDTDLPARLGGEELALLLPETHLEGAAQVAERLRTLIAAERHLAPHGTDFSVTASFGVAAHLGGDGNSVDLMQRADEALYTSKSMGRDRVTTAGWDGLKAQDGA